MLLQLEFLCGALCYRGSQECPLQRLQGQRWTPSEWAHPIDVV